MSWLCLPAALSQLEAAQAFVRENALRAGLDASRVKLIELALEEAIINIIDHAYGGKEGELTLSCTPLPAGVEISLGDAGPPFDPLAAPLEQVATAITAQRIGGMGLRLIRGLSDELLYRREGSRNVLTLRFLRKNGEGR